MLVTVARIALVSPERSRQIETILLRMAQSGQLRGRVGEEQLIGLLEQVCFYYGVLCVFRNSTIRIQVEETQAKAGTKKGAIVVRIEVRIRLILALILFLLSFNGGRKWMKMMISTSTYDHSTYYRFRYFTSNICR